MNSKISNVMNMNAKSLSKLSKEELINMLLKQKKTKPAYNHDDLSDADPFQNNFKPKLSLVPSKKASRVKDNEEHCTKRVPPINYRNEDYAFIDDDGETITSVDNMAQNPPSKIKELNRALKGHAKSYGIELQDNLTKVLVESHLEDLLKTIKGFKFIKTLEVTFEKETIDLKTGERVSIYKTAFFNGKAETITKASDIEPELSMSRQEILNVIDKWVSEKVR